MQLARWRQLSVAMSWSSWKEDCSKRRMNWSPVKCCATTFAAIERRLLALLCGIPARDAYNVKVVVSVIVFYLFDTSSHSFYRQLQSRCYKETLFSDFQAMCGIV